MSARTRAFLFADLAGFTALTEAHGDEEATRIATDFAEHVESLLPELGGELVKTIGDEVMVSLESPDRAVELGLRIVEELARPGLPPVRVGLHYGPAVPRGGDWFGGTVNLASRVGGAARAGEVLLTEHTRDRLSEGAFEIESHGSHRFRHLAEPIRLYRAIGEGGSGHHLEIDPVCRMAVDPGAPGRTAHRHGRTLYFCSGDCARAFSANPDRFADVAVADPPRRAAVALLSVAWVILLALYLGAFRRRRRQGTP